MEALLYRKMDGDEVRCDLCHHRCTIKDGRRGICGVRENQAGVLKTLVYGRLVARHIDPIEKKPLFHVSPGSLSYSVATVGCNFRCRFCQNADIAQLPADQDGTIVGEWYTPEQIVEAALRAGCGSIAYTYTEPTVFFEFALDTARLAHEKGLLNVFVTNGYMTAEALDMIRPFLDAANVDLKAFNDRFYTSQCSAKRQNVMETLRRMKSAGVFVEVTTLIIPGLNDSEDELKDLARFMVSDLGPDTPWHVTRFHPTYRLMDRPATPLETLHRAREIGFASGLRYVYCGNVPGDDGENTKCHQCGLTLIKRQGFRIVDNVLSKGACPACKTPLAGLAL